MSSNNNQDFHLHRVLVGHTDDVRTLATSAAGGIVSGSRDGSIRVWPAEPAHDASGVSSSSSELKGHGDYVTALALASSDDAIVSGSRDSSVRVWKKASGGAGGAGYMLATVLTGHEYQVTGVAVLYDSDDSDDSGDCLSPEASSKILASASLDGSVRLWKVKATQSMANASDAELREHEGPVLCCCAFRATGDAPGADSNAMMMLATGSGDATIRLWEIGKSLDSLQTNTRVFRGHTDSVRALAFIPGPSMLVSGSHDTFVKVWTLDGACLQTMEGHSALIYSVAASPDGTKVASGSEDNTVRLWSMDGNCLQVISHPGCVWAVAFLPNGDLVTGCSDGVIRTWSMDGARVADADVVAAYDASVAEKASAGAGGSTLQSENPLDKLKLHDPSALREPGQHDGQTIVVNEGSFGMVYAWNQQAGDWEKVGEVMSEMLDAPGAGQNGQNGSSYDFNFEVDIADGQPKLMLRCNRGEDAYTVADRFLAENALPTSYRETISNFLIDQTNGAVNINLDTSGAYVDPLTGTGAYVPTNGPGVGGVASTTPATNADPFTGSVATSSGRLPLKGYTLFSTELASDSVLSKLRELNPSEDHPEAHLASDEEWTQVRALTHDAADPLAPTIQKMLANWPRDAIFPVLDAYRALLAMPPSAPGREALKAQAVCTIGPSPPAGSLGAVLEQVFTLPTANPTRMVSLRLMSNLFAMDLLPVVVAPQLDHLLGLASSTVDHVGTKGIAIAYTTFLMNAAVYLQKVTSASAATSLTLAGLAGDVLERSERETVAPVGVTNALLVIGTLRRESLVKPIDIARYAAVIKRLAAGAGDEACRAVAAEVSTL